MSWPARLRGAGAIRRQFVHVIDVMPTLLELAGVPPLPEVNGRRARPMDGASFATVLLDGAAPGPRTEQYYECWSNRAYYRDGWLARSLQKRGEPIDLDNWTLHHLERDFSESTDVSAQHPERLRALTEAFDHAAWQYSVYPLDNRDRRDKFTDAAPDEGAGHDRPRVYLPGMQTVHRADVFPLIANRSFRIRARFAHRADDAGVLWAIGDPTGGLVMYVEDGRLHFHYNGFGERTSLPGVPLPAGAHTRDAGLRGPGRTRGARPAAARRRRAGPVDAARPDDGAVRRLRGPGRRARPPRPGALGPLRAPRRLPLHGGDPGRDDRAGPAGADVAGRAA